MTQKILPCNWDCSPSVEPMRWGRHGGLGVLFSALCGALSSFVVGVGGFFRGPGGVLKRGHEEWTIDFAAVW